MFQSIEDWERDRQALGDAQLASSPLSVSSPGQKTKTQSPNLPPARKQKKKLDLAAIGAENEALALLGDVNWIGKLLEYCASKPTLPAASYTETTIPTELNPRFASSVSIAESALPFPDPSAPLLSFSKKKDAKQWASKLAIDYLVANQHMPATALVPNGSIRFPKAVPPTAVLESPAARVPPPPPPPAQSSVEKSWQQLVPELCGRLGFSIPTYVVRATNKEAPLYEGYADFGDEPRVDGKVGEVKGVYGQKKCRAAIAEMVVAFLRDVERLRREGWEEDVVAGTGAESVGEKRKRDWIGDNVMRALEMEEEREALSSTKGSVAEEEILLPGNRDVSVD